MKSRKIFFYMLAIAMLSSCSVIRPGEVGMVQTLGKLKTKPVLQGVRMYNPFTTKIVRVSTRINEVYSELIVPTKEGLSINAEVSLLYHIHPDSAKNVYTLFGRDFQEVAIMSNFRATTREVTAKYYATELYATEREKIEMAIKTQLFTSVSKYGIIIDAVLLKDIVLPAQITKAIQNKVQAEQEAFQMDFVIMKQKKEAERLIIEAEGIRTSQEIINQSMTKSALQFQYIEMMKGLVTSGNSKVIITNGNMQMMMDPNDDIVK